MTIPINSLFDISDGYDAIVLDQWGVLHDGSAPYPGAIDALQALKARGQRLAVLSNSGKRSAPNAARIAGMGFDPALFDLVMTSGEALWRDIAAGAMPERRFWAFERAPGEARAWVQGLEIELVDAAHKAEALLIMGLPDGSTLDAWRPTLEDAAFHALPCYCSNPDRTSPRADGPVISPGALAFAYRDMGFEVTFYGKPHGPVFEAVSTALGGSRFLMVGDSLEHDIAGAAAAGWDTVLIEGGLYADRFAIENPEALLAELCATYSAPQPSYRMKGLA